MEQFSIIYIIYIYIDIICLINMHGKFSHLLLHITGINKQF